MGEITSLKRLIERENVFLLDGFRREVKPEFMVRLFLFLWDRRLDFLPVFARCLAWQKRTVSFLFGVFVFFLLFFTEFSLFHRNR